MDVMWIVIISVSVLFTLIMSLSLCLCWKKKLPKNDMHGPEGMVTLKNPDENVNHLPSAATCVVDGLTCADTNKTTSSNTRRSLPDIPAELDPVSNWGPGGDNSSEHYATVGQYQNSAKRQTLPNGIGSGASVSQHSSLSQADDNFSPYERVKYDKIRPNKEHPYAQLQPATSSRPLSSSDVQEERPTKRVEIPSTSESPPRSRRTSENSNHGVDIPAASAVAGGVAASPELPYMTPPVTQANFSGDSQDSSKGYTSISVREPLANIIAQTKEMNKNKRLLDPHYATVSDDSDDVYTTIPDPNNIYQTESETYARIPAEIITVEAEVNVSSRIVTEESNDLLYEPAPQPPPPSVDSLKQVAHSYSHSRQASSSSSIANLGSPKPEKRQANSPLPPPPSVPPTANNEKLATPKNLDDLYAKVYKNKRRESDEDSSQEIRTESPKPGPSKEHNYETLKKSPRKNPDPDYEKIKNDEPGYASINGPESITSSDPGYEVLKGSLLGEPNYEELKHQGSNCSDSGYSKIRDSLTIDGYSVVNKIRKLGDKSSSFSCTSQEISLDEPNYESMPSESVSDPNYAALKSGSDTDPNYESVKYLDEPPYEKLDDDSSRTDSEVPGYERVGRGYEVLDTSESSSSNTYNTRSLESHNVDEAPGYEQVGAKLTDVKKTKEENSKEKDLSAETNILDDNVIFQV